MPDGNSPELDSREIDRFFNVGWIVRSGLFRADEIARMRAAFDRLEEMADAMPESGLNKGSQFVLEFRNGSKIIKRVVWAGGSQPYLLQIGCDDRLTVPSSQLLGSPAMEQLLSQAHFKRPGDGVVFDWHQDIQHRDKGAGTWIDVNGKGSFVQTLIVLDDMHADSGPLRFVSGSAAWGRVNFGNHDYDNPGFASVKPPEFDDSKVETVHAQAGDTLFFGPYTAHASFENTSAAKRRVFINGYAYPGANHRTYPGAGAGRLITIERR